MSAMELLKIEDLTKRFGGLVAVNRFSLSLSQGDLAGLIGPNGAGKTTIFNLITGVYKPTEGKIIFMNKEITQKKPHQITALGIARTFQNIRLFSKLSVLDNVKVAFHLRLRSNIFAAVFDTPGYSKQELEMEAKAEELLKAVGLLELKNERASALPYGHQRKLEIARALATQPKLLLLDEPAAGMNPEETIGLMRFIQKIKEDFDLTILLIEHDMKVVMGICEKITVLDHGSVIARGTPEEIQNNPEVIKAYLGTGGVYARS